MVVAPEALALVVEDVHEHQVVLGDRRVLRHVEVVGHLNGLPIAARSRASVTDGVATQGALSSWRLQPVAPTSATSAHDKTLKRLDIGMRFGNQSDVMVLQLFEVPQYVSLRRSPFAVRLRE